MWSSEEESGARGSGEGNKAIESSRDKNLARIACAETQLSSFGTIRKSAIF